MRDLMPRLARPMPRLLGHRERGSVGVLVAVLIGGGVLLGMGALVIDVGQIYQNRAELQNGADAAALAVAKSCAVGTCAPAIAPQYANANASKLTGGADAVNLVCGSGSLGGCPASTGAKTDCPAAPAGPNYVDVHTSTKTASGSTLLPPVFARTLLGDSNYQGTNVQACAQAEWGAPATADTVAFTISACEWDKATKQGTSFASPPPYPPNPLPASSYDQVLTLHTGTSNGSTCATEPAGADGPGAFGWTADQTSTCSVDIISGTYADNTGVSAGSSCQQALLSAWTNRALVFVPIFTAITGTGSGATYTLKGFAAFVVTGYRLPGGRGYFESDWLNSKNDCKPPNVCVNGYFTQGLIPTTGSVGGPDLGATVIKLSG